jgi:hypothetical protein
MKVMCIEVKNLRYFVVYRIYEAKPGYLRLYSSTSSRSLVIEYAPYDEWYAPYDDEKGHWVASVSRDSFAAFVEIP